DFHRLDPASFAWRTATPSSQWSCTTYSLPVSRRTRVKSLHPDENEQSYCSYYSVSEVFAMPQKPAATVNCPTIGGDRLFTSVDASVSARRIFGIVLRVVRC